MKCAGSDQYRVPPPNVKQSTWRQTYKAVQTNVRHSWCVTSCYIWVSHSWHLRLLMCHVWSKCTYLSILQAHTACLSDCVLDVQTAGGAPLHYDFSPLANVSGFHSSPRFTSKGLRYFHSFNLGLCGKEVRSWHPGEVCEKMSLTRVKNLLCLSYRAECWPPVWTM